MAVIKNGRFDAEAILALAREKLLSEARDRARFLRCREHGQGADISIEAAGNASALRISACCESFASEVRQTVFKK